jgi:hypothetical protein
MGENAPKFWWASSVLDLRYVLLWFNQSRHWSTLVSVYTLPYKGTTASNLMHLRSLMKFRAETQFFSGQCLKRLAQAHEHTTMRNFVHNDPW